MSDKFIKCESNQGEKYLLNVGYIKKVRSESNHIVITLDTKDEFRVNMTMDDFTNKVVTV